MTPGPESATINRAGPGIHAGEANSENERSDMMNSVVLARRPVGNPVEADFAVREEPIPSVPDGHFLTRNDFISLDAGFRNWMNEDSGD